MSTIRYQRDIAGVNVVMNAPEMVALLREAAERGAKYAAGVAPRDTGEYTGAFRVATSTKAGPAHDRAEARLINDSDHAIAVEWLNNGGSRVLGRTVDFIETDG